MNTEFLQILLAAWPADEAVRVCDAQGQIVAQNGRALEAVAGGYAPANTCSGDFWKQPQVRERDLVGGWHLQARPVPPHLPGVAEHNRRKDDTKADPKGSPRGDLPPAERRSHPGATHFPDAPPSGLAEGAALKSADKPIEIQTLSRGVVHELRNPLAAIVTAAGLLQDDPSASEETLMLLGVIRKESHRMNRILTEFSAYVKPRPPQPTPFDLSEAVRQEAKDLLRERNGDGPIEVEDLLPRKLRVLADEEHLREVVRHVLRNAGEAMQSGGSLRVEAEPEDGTVLLRLSDSGPGLSPEALERAFQPFFSSKSQSTGLGLSIARTAVEASGGRIWIENIAPESPDSRSTSSRQGRSRGARVFIELPLALDEEEAEAAETSAQ